MAVYLALCLFLCLGSVLWARELGFSNGIADEKRTARMQWAFLLLAGGLFVLVATVRDGIRLKCRKIIPIFHRVCRSSCAFNAVTSFPSTVTVPCVNAAGSFRRF